MGQKNKSYVKGLLIVTFLLFHFSMTYFYVAPEEFNSVVLKNVSGNYMKPFFHQGWSLFAPELPEYNVSIAYRQSQDRQWIELSDYYKNKHYSLRVSHHGRIIRAICNVTRKAVWEMSQNDPSAHGYQDALKNMTKSMTGMGEDEFIELRITMNSIITGDEKQVVF
ncbi:MAG: hypothetical protein CL833_01980 [Crocinitomicaceae bacterium]|nr:hypothetical protein [Crocinitomicaceae bacterium]